MTVDEAVERLRADLNPLRDDPAAAAAIRADPEWARAYAAGFDAGVRALRREMEAEER